MSDERYAVLRIRDFRTALAARFFDTLGKTMLTVVVGWQVYQLTRDPLPLGIVGLAEGLPFMLAALYAGHISDRTEKRRLILFGQAGALAHAAAFLALAFLDRPPLVALYLCLALGGLFRSFYWSAMGPYIQMTVPKAIYSKAAAWGSGIFQIASVAGPALGGAVYGWKGVQAAYACVAACFLLAFLFAAALKPIPAVAAAQGGGVDDLLSGIRFVLSKPVMLAAMTLDMFGVLFGGVSGVLPVFAAVLGVGASGLGLLQAAPATGALACSLYLAHVHAFRETGRTFVACVAGFGACILAFALSRNFYLSCAILAASGAVDCVGMVLRSSIYQALTPDHLRGRVSSVNGVFIRSSNEIGYFESGLAARVMGLVPSVLFGGVMTLVSVAVALRLAPDLRKFRLEDVR